MAAATMPAEGLKKGKLLIASSRVEFRGRIIKSVPPNWTKPEEALGGAEALLKLEQSPFQTLVLDSQLDDLNAEELVAIIRGRYPELNVVVISSDNQLSQASFDFAAEARTETDISERSDDQESHSSEKSSSNPSSHNQVSQHAAYKVESLPGMIGSSRKMQHIYRLARLIAPRDTAVLIVGATGTGKELVARGVHELSRRSRGPFVVVNCAAIPESLLEAELFGFTRGAFTGAFQSRLGRIHAAHGGTLLLDEVGELPLSMQAKLLRFVQEGEVQRLGSSDLFRVDTRLIAATNANLGERVGEKQFREDLYYRLAVFPLELPPLRNRAEDILPLAQHFLEILCRQGGVSPKTFSVEAANILRKHHWPGNVRELHHWIERAFVLAESNDEIRVEDLHMPCHAS